MSDQIIQQFSRIITLQMHSQQKRVQKQVWGDLWWMYTYYTSILHPGTSSVSVWRLEAYPISFVLNQSHTFKA